MVATVSGSSHQYEHTVNTLKYADRAKEIKTHVHENRGTVETHIAEYQRMIDALQEERRELRAEVDRLKGGGGGGGGRVGVGGPSNGLAAAVNGGRVPRESGGNGGWNGGGHEQGLTVEEVEKFAQELAEATDACAKAQRVLLERQTREASARAAAAASALEALAPSVCSGPAGTDAGKRPTGLTDRVAAAAAGKKKSVGFFGFGLGGKGGGGGGDAGADAGSDGAPTRRRRSSTGRCSRATWRCFTRARPRGRRRPRRRRARDARPAHRGPAARHRRVDVSARTGCPRVAPGFTCAMRALAAGGAVPRAGTQRRQGRGRQGGRRRWTGRGVQRGWRERRRVGAASGCHQGRGGGARRARESRRGVPPLHPGRQEERRVRVRVRVRVRARVRIGRPPTPRLHRRV